MIMSLSAENSLGVMALLSTASFSALIRSIIKSAEGTGLSTPAAGGVLVSGSSPPILVERRLKNSSLVIKSFSASSFNIRKREMMFCSCGVNKSPTAGAAAARFCGAVFFFQALLMAALFWALAASCEILNILLPFLSSTTSSALLYGNESETFAGNVADFLRHTVVASENGCFVAVNQNQVFVILTGTIGASQLL